ncbi:MAG TPA: S8 family serine peptidase [Herpetosiphonaceae bacterium]
MRTRRFSSIALLALATSALPLGTTQAQAPGRIDREKIAAERQSLRSQTVAATNLRTGGPLAERNASVKVLIELDGEPTTKVYAAAQARGTSVNATAEAQRQLGLIKQAQQRILSNLQGSTINAKVIYRTQQVYNGIAVRVNANQLANIRRIPGVKAIHQLNTKHLDNASSVPLIGAPELWNSSGLNNTGEGIKIGIIDTGIDYLHTNNGGSGLEADYARNDETIITDNVGFPSAKVVGGYDFAGDEYDASDPALETPAPDPDPMDCNGHGSHVAGTSAGYGVNADGSTYTGAYGPSTPFNSLRIGPGVAPKASLYALKVFGCDGSTDVTDLAIEWAVDPNGDGDFSDRLDVINMSLGSDYGSAYDSSSIASDNAAAAGVIVVASAGNSNDTYYISGSPGVSARTINVASSVDSTSIFDGFRVNSPASIAGVKPAAQSVAFDWTGKSPVTANLVYPVGAGQNTGCTAFNASNQALIAGKIVLLDWTEGQCGSVARGAAVVAAGGVGFILADNSEDFDLLITGSAVIPGVSTTKQVGDELKTALASSTVNVTLTPEYNNSIKLVDPNLNDTLSAFSSRGPRRGDSLLKPDISAPGQSIFSTNVGTGDEGTSLNGTSMASPHVAGSMALLRQMHPDWTVEELKALAMNTANKDLRSARAANSPIYGPGRVGAGRITLTDAAGSDVVAYNANEAGVVSVSFGAVEVLGETTAVKNIRVVNKSNNPVSYNVSYRSIVDTPGVSFSLSRSTVELEPNGFANIVVTMRATASQMKHTHDVTVSEVQQLARHWMSEEAGYVVLSATTGSTAINDNPNLRVPVYAAARPASDMRAQNGQLDFGTGPTGSDEIDLVGQDVNTGTNVPTDTISLVTALELQHSSPNDQESADIVNNADLKYVGVHSDVLADGSGAPNGDIEAATISFGVATYGNWSSPNESEFDVYIDTNRDGEDDYVLFNWNLGLATGGTDATDVIISVLINLNTGQLLLADYVNVVPSVLNSAIFNNSVMVLPVAAADLGLTANSGAFNYRVFTFSRDADGVVDDSGTLTYNPAQPGLDLSGGIEGVPYYADLDGEVIPVDFNRAAFVAGNSKGVLLLHHHNVSERRAEVVRVKGILGDRIYMPMIRQQ